MGLAISFFFYWALSGTGQPGNLMRLMTFDSARTLRRSIAMLSIYFSLIYFPLVIIFCCARVLVPGLDQDPDRIMPKMAFTLAEGAHIPWLAGVLVAAPFAAAMSTVDSFMLMISASAVRDVYQQKINPAATPRRLKTLSYVCTVIVGVVVTLGAINPPRFLQDLIVFTGGALAAAFLIPVGLALYWRRFNAPGALSAMIGGLAAYLSLCVVGFFHYRAFRPLRPLDLDPLIWGLAASLACGVLVAITTRPPPKHLVRKFFYCDPRVNSSTGPSGRA
jgi:SSS family solute:Na+ symporter/sodium/pantothenate symporter